MLPRYSANLLPDNAAVKAQDCHFEDGTLNPIKANLDTGETLPSDTKTMFLYEKQHWFSWSADVDAIKSPIANDPHRRVYYTGDSYPKVTYNTIFSGVRMPANSYRLGIPAPAQPPGIKSFVQADIQNAVTLFYVTTYVSAIGEESQPSGPSQEVECWPIGLENDKGEKGKSVITLQPPGVNQSNITKIRIYRVATGAGGGEFLRVAEVPMSQAEYTDTTPDSQLLEILETETYAMPPDDMSGLCAMANGICAGFRKNELLFSESYLPYAWPEEYRLSVEEDIVAIEPIGTSLVVGTEGDPYLYTGVSPANIAGQKLEISQACVSRHSMVNVGMAVLYACPDGLVAIAPDGVSLITQEVVSPLQWRKMLDPATIKAYRHEAKYVAIHSKGAFIFDPSTRDLRLLNDNWVTGYTNPIDDSLYLFQNNKVMQFRQSDDYKQLTWTSKEYDAIAMSLSCVRIIADDLTKVSFKMFADGREFMHRDVGNVIETFTLPAVRGDKWQFEIKSQSRIESVKIATSKQELKL